MAIIILILTLGMTIIPMTGKLWLLKESKLKIYWKGWTFICIAILALILGVIQISEESIIQSNRDNNQVNTLNNTEKIISNLDTAMDKIELKLFRIDSLNIKLDSLENRTIESIENRDKILSDFNKLTGQLEKIYIQQNTNIKENSPLVEIFDNIKWIKEKKSFKILIELINQGGRIATNVGISTWFFLADDRGEIVSHKLLSQDLSTDTNLPPWKESGKRMQYKFPNFPKKLQSDSLSMGYIIVKYSYTDFATDSTFYNSEGFFWRGFKLDSFVWTTMNLSNHKKVDEYINKNKLELK